MLFAVQHMLSKQPATPAITILEGTSVPFSAIVKLISKPLKT